MGGNSKKTRLEIAVAHARLRWAAETENAARLSHRENGILTVIATILGLGLFKAPDLHRREPALLFVAVVVAVAATLVCLLLALRKVLWIPQSKEGTPRGPVAGTRRQEEPDDEAPLVYASENLRWTRDPKLHPTKLRTEHEALTVSYKLITRAANSLSYRNIRRKEGIELGQRFLFVAAAAATLSIVLYAFLDPSAVVPETSSVPSQQPAGVDHADRKPQDLPGEGGGG